ncbi:MAG: protein kinase [Kiritimatiellae bacterium]|nr:protein kinase [Kiritimatiellia bacterium]
MPENNQPRPPLPPGATPVIKILSDTFPKQPAPTPAVPPDPEEPTCSVRDLLHTKVNARYQVEEQIGLGGMGAVSVARDVNCHRRVAMKRLAPHAESEPNDVFRFIEEAQITAQLERPNIIPVHELGLDAEETVFYTMKLVQGATLTDIILGIRRADPAILDQYPLEKLLTIFQKACDAVAFAHSRNVIHRDIKPDNIMIGDYGEVLIMDWGLAKPVNRTDAPKESCPIQPPKPPPPDSRTHLPCEEPEAFDKETGTGIFRVETVSDEDIATGLQTMSGKIMGTPGFMAPEQTHPYNRVYTPAADIYSLGAVLYSILTLRPPIRSKKVEEMIEEIRSGAITPPVDYNIPVEGGEPKAVTYSHGLPVRFLHCPGSVIPSELSRIAMKAMANDPETRYHSVKEFQQDVENFQHGRIWQLLVDEEFTNFDDQKIWLHAGGEYEINDHELRMHGGKPQVLLLRQDVPGDVRIEFECRQEGGLLNTIGCFISGIRSDNPQDIPGGGYEFKFGGYDNTMNVLMRSDRIVWKEPSVPIVAGKTFKIIAERSGSRLRMLVNDREIFSYIDPDPLTGEERVAIGMLGWLADTRFTHIKVYSMGTPWKTDVLDMAERQLQMGHYTTAIDLYNEVIHSFPDADRTKRAQEGLRMAGNRLSMHKSLPKWLPDLQKAWKGAPVKMRMDNDGLVVDISFAGIEDLSPLRGLPITKLYCPGNRIRDLSPLKGAPLQTLNCSGNPITSIDPLRGMALDTLICEGCQIRDIEPLRGAPLTLFNCGGNRMVSGIGALSNTPQLSWLSCWGNNLTDLEPLRGLPITALYCDLNNITNIAPLEGMPLNTFNCSINQIEDFAPLRGMPVSSIHCSSNLLTCLDALAEAPLNVLSCHANYIKSLEPLAGKKLNALLCGHNPLTSLDPFVDQAPDSFYFDCETLSDSYLEWALARWKQQPATERHAHQAEIILAMRQNDRERLRALAHHHNGHAYLLNPQFLLWEEACQQSERFGAHLVTIRSHEENDFINSLFPLGCWMWIGLVTEQGRHRWTTGDPFEFNAFTDPLRDFQDGPKVFFNGRWTSELSPPNSYNCSIMEWFP